MKVAYWPGCVSRGFTPELHGSMAKVAPLLDIELVELDRAACCGAGVIAEHNQELADTLNARTFALAQRDRRRRADDEHLLDLPGRAERVPGAPGRQRRVPQPRQRDAGGRGPDATRRASTNKNFLWLLVEEIGLDDAARAKVKRPLTEPQGRALLRLLHRAPDRPPRDRPASTRATRTCDQVIEALGGTVIDYAGSHKCCGFPIITMNKEASLKQAGPPPRRRDRRRGRLPRHALPAVPPQPRPPAAAGRAHGRPRAGHAGPAPAPARRPRARPRAQGAGDAAPRRQADVGHRLDDVGRRGRRDVAPEPSRAPLVDGA